MRGCDVVLSVLADGTATCAVLLDTDVLAALTRGGVVCDLATSGVAAARALGAGLAAAGVPFVDAPVSGSVPAVEAGTLLVMAGGDPAAIAAAEPILAAFARRVVRVGDVSAGQAMKLRGEPRGPRPQRSLGRGAHPGRERGIARRDAYDVFADSVVAAPFVGYKRAAFLDPDTPVAMSLDMVRKDLRLIAELAADVGVAIAVTAAAEVVVEAACEAGHGSEDMAALSRFTQVRRLS